MLKKSLKKGCSECFVGVFKMINFAKAQFVLFDFDDTLCIHKYHETGDFREYTQNMILRINFWKGKGCLPNLQIQEFIHLCKAKGKRYAMPTT